MRERIRFDVREAEHESAEAENRQADGEEVALADASRVPKLRKPKIAKNSEITPITVSVRKIDRQPFKSVCTPPKVGPIAGATLMAMPTVPIAIPRRDRG